MKNFTAASILFFPAKSIANAVDIERSSSPMNRDITDKEVVTTKVPVNERPSSSDRLG